MIKRFLRMTPQLRIADTNLGGAIKARFKEGLMDVVETRRLRIYVSNCTFIPVPDTICLHTINRSQRLESPRKWQFISRITYRLTSSEPSHSLLYFTLNPMKQTFLEKHKINSTICWLIIQLYFGLTFKCYPLDMAPINRYRVYESYWYVEFAHSFTSSCMIGIMMGLVKEIWMTNVSVLRILLLL